MDLKAEYGFDDKLADTGVWVSVDGNGTAIKIAKMPNARFTEYMEPHHRRSREMGTDVAEEIYERAMAKYILLDWKGIEEEGTTVDAALEQNRERMLHQYTPFKALVIRAATSTKNFQAHDAEIKN